MFDIDTLCIVSRLLDSLRMSVGLSETRKQVEMLKQQEIQRATRERTCCTMLSCDVVHATRDYELVGIHVFALHNDSQIITPILCV